MKKLYLSILFTLSIVFCYAQSPIVLGIDCDGGTFGKGQIFQFDTNFSAVNTLHEFAYNEGSFQYESGDLVLANNGKYYGVQGQSDRNRGVIFEYDLDSNTYKIVFDFSSNQIFFPLNGLVKRSNGELYGVAYFGTNYPNGLIYKFNPSTKTIAVVHSFNSANKYPNAVPLIAQNDKLYGSTEGDNSGSNRGSLYEFDFNTNTFSSVYNFTGWYRNDNSNLVESNDSCIYGIREGSYPYYGRLYKYDYKTGVFSQEYLFNQATYPQKYFRNLFIYNGNLFVTAYNQFSSNSINSQSVLFKLNLNQNPVSISSTFQFIDSLHGGIPRGSLKMNGNHELIGALFQGTNDGTGSLFKIDTNLTTITVNKPFSKSSNIFHPTGRFILKNDSTVIGIATNMPTPSNYTSYVSKYSHGIGAIYEYNFYTNTLLSKQQLGSSNLGHVPSNNLVYDTNGVFYMTNKRGGNNYAGTILSYDYISNSITKIYDVDSSQFDQINTMSYLNGSTLVGMGTKDTLNQLFEFDLNNNSIQVQHTFSHPDVYYDNVLFNLIEAQNGNFYSVNMDKQLMGQIFEYNPSSKTVRKVYNLANDTINYISSEFTELNNKLYATYEKYGVTGVLEFDYLNGTVQHFPFPMSNIRLERKSPWTLHSNGKLYGLGIEYYGGYVIEFDVSKPNNKFTVKAKIQNELVVSGGKFIEGPNQKLFFKVTSKDPYSNFSQVKSNIVEYNLNTNSIRKISSNISKANCPSINNFILLPNTLVGISKPKIVHFSLYPNPAKDFVFINSKKQIEQVEILNSNGKVVKEVKNPSTKINISNLPSGIYFFKIYSNQQVEVKKLIK